MFPHLMSCPRVADRSVLETAYLVGLLPDLIFPGSDRLADPREVIDGIYLELREAIACPCATVSPPLISGSELGGPGPSKSQPCPEGSGDVPGPRPTDGVTTLGTTDGTLLGFAENHRVGGVAWGPKALSPRWSQGMAEMVGE